MGEAVYVSTATRDCPSCGKSLEAAAVACPDCGAKFEIFTRAYCTHCHKLIHIASDGKCPDCRGSDLLDQRLYSTLIAAGTPPSQPAAVGKPIAEPAHVDTKKCPVCAETIKAEARLCRYCGARFEVSVKGYCMNCHTQVVPDANDNCPRCGGGIVDRHVTSTMVSAPSVKAASAAPPVSTAPASYGQPATSATSSGPVYAAPVVPLGPKPYMPIWQLYLSSRGRIGRLTFFLKGILVILGVYVLLGIILGLISGLTSTPAELAGMQDVTYSIIGFSLIPFLWIWFMLLAKRLHDLNRSGWNILFVLIPIVGQLIYLGLIIACFFVKGTGPNQYGEQGV